MGRANSSNVTIVDTGLPGRPKKYLCSADRTRPNTTGRPGWIFAPVAWLIGIPWHDAAQIGNLLGTRMVLNEFVAFAQLGTMKGALDPRSFTIATFALCGFANFSSIGIQIGGIGALAPEQRQQLAKFGIRAMLAGTMANLMSASIVGILS